MVQLKAGVRVLPSNSVTIFQFQYGTIKRLYLIVLVL